LRQRFGRHPSRVDVKCPRDKVSELTALVGVDRGCSISVSETLMVFRAISGPVLPHLHRRENFLGSIKGIACASFHGGPWHGSCHNTGR